MTIRSARRRTPALPTTDERSQEELAQQVRSLLAEAQALSVRLAALNEIAATMQAALDLDTMLQTLAAQARWLIDFDHCSVALRSGLLYRVLALGQDGPPSPVGEYGVARGAIGRALQEGHELLLSSLSDDDTLPADAQSAVIVPLRSGRDLVGTLNFFSNTPQAYSQTDLRVATALALQVSVTIQNTRLFNAVTEARDELHTILESISDSVLVIDTQARVLMINRSLRELLGLPADDLTGRKALHLLRLAEHQQPLASRKALEPLFDAWRVQSQCPKSGTCLFNDGRHIEWVLAPLSGTTGGAVITLRDVSARMQLEQMRIDLTDTLVHDLRTPLTAMILGIQLLRYTKNDPQGAALHDETIIRLEHSANQMVQHVNTILDVNKLEGGELVLDRLPQDLGMLVCAELQPLLSIAHHSNQELSSDIPPSLPLVLLDKELIRRVVTNLVGNALKFTPPEGRIHVSANLTREGDALEVTVEDSGPGVSEELRTRIFDKYVQATGVQRRNGTGLGLFFCRLAVEAHGGAIGVRSGPGGGSVFWFTLPLFVV